MDFADILQKYQALTLIIVSMALLAIFLKVWWEEVRFYWLRVWSAMPVVGKIASLSKDIDNIDNNQWMHSEKTLCANFLPHYQSVNKDAAFYDKCTSYLNKAQETGRDNLHFLGWILIAAMVFVEAMGFSFVLAGYTIPGASEAMQQYGALGIAFLISCLLVFLTHETGAELHKNRLVGKIRAWHDHGDGRLIPQKGVTLENNEIDEDSAIYQQLLNRVDTNPNVTASHKITISTIVFVLLVAVGATYVRNSVMNVELTEDAVLMNESGGGDVYVDPYADPVLADLAPTVNEANQQAQQEILDDTKEGALVTFIVLAVIFVFLQIMGVLIGFFKGFAGKESKSARAYIGKFKTRDEFARYYDRKRSVIAQIAQKHLASLQQKMAKRAQTSSANGTLIQHIANHSDRSFLNYVDMEAAKDNVHRKTHYTREQNYVQHQVAASASVSEGESGQPVQSISVESTGLPDTGESLEARMARIRREKEAQTMTEEQKMAAMSDEELAQYMTEKGMI
ncbi:hypothetical protein J7438_20385 [Thalassotalea sp. G20_0]|uniref:hypothetical protein n=1 Tax=Thalassotalea sp. G20_0 TaxID=2821093 RepID=UPI001ADB5486|nr:hypothetical protein [Thalassotalea sp. G20_0]MBO9496420.1 hypothetical protein [Thalassotalea sp. G20_0]